jgi:hypothetical protein
MTDAPNAETDAPAPVAPAAPPAFVGGKPRLRTIALDWPVEYDGKVYSRIHLQRLTAKEVADWVESIKDKQDVRFPLYRDDDGNQIPDVVLDGMDDDDLTALNEAAADFLPRRFRGVMASDSGHGVGDPTEPSSGA